MVVEIAIFIDTNVFISYFNERDQNHRKAKKIIEDIFDKDKYGEAITSDYVFDESVTVCLVKTKSKKTTVKLGEKIINSTYMLNVSAPVFQMSWDLFKKLKMSFTDCTNIILALTYGIKNMATFDKDFKKIDNLNVIDS